MAKVTSADELSREKGTSSEIKENNEKGGIKDHAAFHRAITFATFAASRGEARESPGGGAIYLDRA